MQCESTTLLLFLTLSTHAHVQWIYPAPRPSTDVKTFPCGGNAEWNNGPITRLAVGINEVIFDEFICHSGDMVRIALSMDNDTGYDQTVLLDRLPHNDLCGTSSDNDFMAVNITLPNVDCIQNECSLQIIQVMASKFKGDTCKNPSGIAEQCGQYGRMYYSCARVEIAGDASSLPMSLNDYYGSEVPVDYEWPLVSDWCRDSNSNDPWRTCQATPQAQFLDEETIVHADGPITTSSRPTTVVAPIAFATPTEAPAAKSSSETPAPISITVSRSTSQTLTPFNSVPELQQPSSARMLFWNPFSIYLSLLTWSFIFE